MKFETQNQVRNALKASLKKRMAMDGVKSVLKVR